MKNESSPAALIQAAQKLAQNAGAIRFESPVAHIYNPLDYAWAAHEQYLRSFGGGKKRVVFLGMNPGPFGMVQTGVPFGDVAAVRDWLKIKARIGQPAGFHPSRPVRGFDCPRGEVSGQRLWGLFAARYPQAGDFFADHFVVNYCPLAFVDAGGRNLTPDKFSPASTMELFRHCDEHLAAVIQALDPEWVIGVGGFAEKRARLALEKFELQFGKILHPSPASPAANQNWAAAATRQLQELKIW